jgi:hypothetical protein
MYDVGREGIYMRVQFWFLEHRCGKAVVFISRNLKRKDMYAPKVAYMVGACAAYK